MLERRGLRRAENFFENQPFLIKKNVSYLTPFHKKQGSNFSTIVPHSALLDVKYDKELSKITKMFQTN